MVGQQQRAISEWTALKVAEGYSSSSIIDALQAAGCTESYAQSLLEAICQESSCALAAELMYKWRKMQSLTAILGDLLRATAGTTSYDEVRDASLPEEIESMHALNLPARIPQLTRWWPLLQKLNWETFGRNYGEVEVGTLPAEMDPRPYAFQTHDLLERFSLSDLLHAWEKDHLKDRYVVARADILQDRRFGNIRDAILPLPGVTDQPAEGSNPDLYRMWIGPPDTLTPLHHDHMSVILVQILGRKRVLLVGPRHYAQIDTDRYCFSAYRQRPDELSRMLDGLGVENHVVTLEEGDGLLIPVGWWHAVESLTMSLSVTLQNLNFTPIWKQPYLGERSISGTYRPLQGPLAVPEPARLGHPLPRPLACSDSFDRPKRGVSQS